MAKCWIQSIITSFIRNLKNVAHIQGKKVIIGDRSPNNPDIKITGEKRRSWFKAPLITQKLNILKL